MNRPARISAYRIGRISGHLRRLSGALAGSGEAAYGVSASLRAFLTTYQHAVERQYASAHNGRLPGSTRTARLRKKRRDAVLWWWREQ